MNVGARPVELKENHGNGSQLGIAIIGCGYWGMNYVRIFNELMGSQVRAVCDQKAERLQEVRRRFPHVYFTTEIEEIVSHPGADAVVVCTEATAHYDIARRLLRAGKHVLVEKPLTTRSTHADELIDLAASPSHTP